MSVPKTSGEIKKKRLMIESGIFQDETPRASNFEKLFGESHTHFTQWERKLDTALKIRLWNQSQNEAINKTSLNLSPVVFAFQAKNKIKKSEQLWCTFGLKTAEISWKRIKSGRKGA